MGHATFVLKIPETISYIHRSPANKYSNPTLPQFIFQNKRKKRFGLDLASRIQYLDEKRNPERSKLVLIKKCLRPKIEVFFHIALYFDHHNRKYVQNFLRM